MSHSRQLVQKNRLASTVHSTSNCLVSLLHMVSASFVRMVTGARRQRLPFSTAPAALLWSQLCLKPPVNSKVGSYTWVDFTAVPYSDKVGLLAMTEFQYIAGLQKSLLKNVPGRPIRWISLFRQWILCQWVTGFCRFRFLVSGCSKVGFIVGGRFCFLGSGFHWLGSGFRASDWISWISWILLFRQTGLWV